MPAKKKAKSPAQTNPSAYYYVVEITRAGGKSHLITTRGDEAKATARIARDRDGNPTEVFRIDFANREKRIAFLRAVMKDPADTWKRAAQQLTFRSADVNQPKKQTDGSTTENRTANRQAKSSSTRGRSTRGRTEKDSSGDNDAFWGGLTSSEEGDSQEEGLFEI